MSKIQSLAATIALLCNVSCMTTLDYYTKETNYGKPHTVQEYQHFSGWCKKTGRIEDQIWAHQKTIKLLEKGSEEELTETIELAESYLVLLRDYQSSISIYSVDKNEIWIKAQQICKEALDVSNSIPLDDIRFYSTRDQIRYLCERFNHPKKIHDFQDF